MTTKPSTKDDKKAKKPNTIPHEGKYKFSDKERLELGDAVAEQYMKRGTIDAEFSTVKSEFKAKLDACESRIQKLTEKISNGHEPRMFECLIEKNIDEKTISYIDVDTNNVIESRKMQPNELQLAITDKLSEDKKK